MRWRWRRKGIAGFTLVELLVVMAIITILIAIVVPVTIQGRNRARGAKCLSNLRQLGAIAHMYAEDFDGTLPLAPGSPFLGGFPTSEIPGGTAATFVAKVYQAHHKAEDVFRCPNDKGAPAFGFANGTGVCFDNAQTSYLWNMARKDKRWVVNGVAISSLHPQDILFADYGADWHGNRMRRGLHILEQSRTNVVHADGHADSECSFTFETGGGDYSAAISGSGESLRLAGYTDYGGAYVFGTFGANEASEPTIELSGIVDSDGGVYEVERIFTFASSTSVEDKLRKIVTWIEGLLSG